MFLTCWFAIHKSAIVVKCKTQNINSFLWGLLLSKIGHEEFGNLDSGNS